MDKVTHSRGVEHGFKRKLYDARCNQDDAIIAKLEPIVDRAHALCVKLALDARLLDSAKFSKDVPRLEHATDAIFRRVSPAVGPKRGAILH